jgi:hypothetical protein
VSSVSAASTKISGGTGSGGINEDISYAALRRNAADLKARKSRIKDIFSVEGLDKCEAMDESRRIDRKAFAAKHFDISEGGLFTKKDDVTTLLRWSSKPLKKPLLRAVHESKNKKAYEDSCQYMRNIQGYMLDRKSGKSEIDHVRKICSTALKYQDGEKNDSTSLRTIMWDELYCQLMKQTYNAPRESTAEVPSSLERGWKLFHCIAGVLQPSASLLPLVLKHCDDALAEGGGPRVAALSKRTKLRLLRLRKLRPRTWVPCKAELEASLVGSHMNQRVYTLPDDSGMIKPIVIPVESWLSAASGARLVAASVGVKDPRPFALFEAVPKILDDGDESNDDETADIDVEDSTSYNYKLIPSDTPLCDVIARFVERVEEDLKEKKGKDAIKGGVRLEHIVFGVRYFIPPIPTDGRRDNVADQFLFLQALHEVRGNSWKFKQAIMRPEFYKLAALQILAQARGASPCARLKLTTTDLISYLPRNLRDKESAAGVAKTYAELSKGAGPRGKKWHEHREEYLDIVKQWSLFGMTQFMIDSRGSTIKPEGRLLLAVCPHIINIIDSGSMSLIHQLSYKALYRVEPPTRANRAITLRFRPKNAGDAPPVLKCTTVEEGQEKQLVMTIKKYQEYVWCSRATIISLSLSFVVLYEVCLRISIERFHFISTKLHYID